MHKRKKSYARSLRKGMTEAEDALWRCLRNRKCQGIKFRRQVPIGPYIVDFLCVSAKLIIELDGDIHNAQQEYDEDRASELQRRGYRILRFSNKDVMNNLSNVCTSIAEVANTLYVHTYKTEKSIFPSPGR